LKALGALFLQVLKLCETAGLVKLGHVALDGTKMKANAHASDLGFQNETEHSDHSASLGESITASTRIRFSVHTGQEAATGLGVKADDACSSGYLWY
jgi:hypothetical protein